MRRHRAYWPLDDAPELDADAGFRGVNARLDPAQLQPGDAAHAVNCLFQEGYAATRKGARILAWGAQGYAADDPEIIRPYGDVLVARAFNDPISGIEWIIIVTANGVYRTRSGMRGVPIALPPGEAVAMATDLQQTYNGMILARGEDFDPLYMDDLAVGFRVLPAADSGKEAMPPCTHILYFQNRAFCIDARRDSAHVDSVWVSDFGATSSVLQGQAFYQSFRINQGSADRLVSIAKFNDTTLIAAKAQSIYAVSNIVGDNAGLAENATLNEITREYGCIAPRSWVQVGNDLWFLAHKRGVVSIRQTETNALQGVDVPVSRDVDPYIQRINWDYASQATAETWNNLVFFAVPIDGSTVNNAILVYSTLTQRWAGVHTGEALKVRDWIKFTLDGVVRLGFLSTHGYIYLYLDGYNDHVGDEEGNITYQPIATTLRTRGYGAGIRGTKRFSRAQSRIRTWNPSYTVAGVADGHREITLSATVTKDRTRYIRPAGQARWDPSNANNDWDTPFREDYSMDGDGLQPTDPEGDGTVAFDIMQEFDESWNLRRQHGQHLQLEIASSRGRIEVASVEVSLSQRGPTRTRSLA